MAVKTIFGRCPKPPRLITARSIRRLRAPDGSKPCPEGLKAALSWIGDRRVPLARALQEAETKLREWFDWGLSAMGMTGSGYGYGSGDGSGDGYGDGYGSGDGYGDGYGSGDGSGDGSGSGDGTERNTQ